MRTLGLREAEEAGDQGWMRKWLRVTSEVLERRGGGGLGRWLELVLLFGLEVGGGALTSRREDTLCVVVLLVFEDVEDSGGE
jgi:hypothetical protein